MYQPDIENRITLPDSLRSPELHDLSDFPEVVRTNRPLIVVLAIAAMLTVGHFVYHGHVTPMDASVPQPEVIARG